MGVGALHGQPAGSDRDLSDYRALTAVCMMGYYVIYHRNAERSVRFGLKETETFIE